MSIRHPIISVTGSSGAGTTSRAHTFEQIFRREQISAAFIEGDAFHRYDREAMRRRWPRPRSAGNHHFSHFGHDGEPARRSWRDVFRSYSATGTGRTRHYVHDLEDAQQFGRRSGSFTDWEDLPAPTDLLFYEGLHGAVVATSVNIAQYADLKIGVVPVINLEWIQKIHRDKNDRGYSDRRRHGNDPAPHAGLRALHLPAVHRDGHQLPAHPDGRHLEPVHRALHSDRRTSPWW